MSLASIQEYVQNYDRAVYTMVAAGRGAPSERRLQRFEEAIGFEFPDDFRILSLSPLSGLCFEVYDDLWDREPIDAEQEWVKLFDVHVFGLAALVPERLDLNRELAALPPEETDLIPFMARGSEGKRFCFDLDHQIILWSPLGGHREVIKESLFELLVKEFQGLEARWEDYKELVKAQAKAAKRKKKKAKAACAK